VQVRLSAPHRDHAGGLDQAHGQDGEPRTLLPHDVNPSKGAPELVEFNDAALDIIHRIDANMFEEWGYKKRTAFNLRVQTGAPH
jgi:hypothetical protein